ncbi:uncharacterized protein LOC123875839 [Maniola jurtina]|uniref:uncharacterized protein LOC123875839 n=1 Tax=Maniola jurtina TaxID=191418 RepID=UPI001E68FB25|nr:uncharacterized protein LOC123875839 [Maniola jurtina]
MQIVLFAILFFVEIQCKITKAVNSKDDVKIWKPDDGFNESLPSTMKRQRQFTKNDKPIFRQNLYTQYEAKSKWPKILRKSTTKSAARLTKMHLMQEEKKTTIIDLNQLNEKNQVISEYLSSYSIKQQLEKISKHIPHSNVTLEVIGRTKEYQDIVLLKITKESGRYFRADDEKYADDQPQKKIIFIVHGLSVMGIRSLPCLSWAPSFLTLVSYYVEHLDEFDIFLIPMANPDGYAFLQSSNIWDKNVAPQTECAGVALDRNFNVAWNNSHSISSCSQEYPGMMPFSEEETQAIRSVFHKYSHKIVAYLNVHAGTYGPETFKGDAVLYPKGYTDSITDEDKYIDLKGEIDEAIRNASFQVFSVAVETLYNWYGKVSGSSVDYAATVYGIPFALEIVMQLYNNENVDEYSENFSESALTQVWSRVIDVIFNYIWKTTNKGMEVRFIMAVWIAFVFGLVSIWQVGCRTEDNNYDDYALIKIYPTNTQQIEALRRLGDPEYRLEFLKRSRSFNDSTDVLVPPDEIPNVQNFLKSQYLDYDVKPNYGRSLESAERTPKRRILRGFGVFEYHSFQAIQEFIDNLAKRHPDLVTLQNLGTSYQGRRMKLVKISSNPDAGNPIIFIDAGIHAREWVAPAMAVYLIHRLVNDPEARQELDGVDWYILPVVNPDGYEYTRTSRAHRMWRKTRSKNNLLGCFGVDGNRNYGFKWAVSGVSSNPCDTETYAGPKPFSEVETQMVRNIMLENSERLKLYVSLHSYGQYLVYPWGYTGDFLPKEWKKLDSLARSVSDAVQKAGGEPFRVLSAGKWYPAAGGSDDFAYGVVGVPYSFTMELTDGYEFIYPERLLRVVLPQFYEGFRTFAEQIKMEFSPKYAGRNVQSRR